MNALLYPRADEALSSGHQNVVYLRELELTQPIKRIVEMNLK
jgi:hypothetical protein